MTVHAADIAAAATRISRYLNEHPNAADTLDGVAVWWLSGNTSEEYLVTVQCAINRLMADGAITRRLLIDGTIIYERSGTR
jgi:hypothetical protein